MIHTTDTKLIEFIARLLEQCKDDETHDWQSGPYDMLYHLYKYGGWF